MKMLFGIIIDQHERKKGSDHLRIWACHLKSLRERIT